MLKKFVIAIVLIVGLVGAWLLYMSMEGNREVTLDLVVDRSIEKIEMYDSRDYQTPVATLYPVFDGRRNELPLRVYRDVEYQRTLRSIYYFFIMYTADGASKSDPFTFEKFGPRVQFTIGQTGQWQILKQ